MPKHTITLLDVEFSRWSHYFKIVPLKWTSIGYLHHHMSLFEEPPVVFVYTTLCTDYDSGFSMSKGYIYGFDEKSICKTVK